MRVLQWGFVLLVGVRATPFPSHLVHLSQLARLDKRALVFDATCETRYDDVSAKSLIVASMDIAPKMAKAGDDALGMVVATLQGTPPTWGPGEQDRVLKMYTSLFGKPTRGTKANHIPRINLIRSALGNLEVTSSSNPPDIIIHCDNSWLLDNAPEGGPPRPDDEQGKTWLYDSDRGEWIQLRGGSICVGENSGATLINEDTETRQER
jgi:hypothetical protein